MKIKLNRYIVLTAALVINLCLGSIYAWSILAEQIKQENPEWSLTSIALIFSLLIITYAITTIFSGRLQDRIGPRWVITAGGLMMGGGVILSGMTDDWWGFILGYSIMAGIGIGFAFVSLACVVKWFPQQRGLASGLVTGTFGAGGLVFGPLAAGLIGNSGTITTTLIILGMIYLLAITISAQFIDNPEPYQIQTEDIAFTQEDISITPGQMLRDSRFYILWLLFFIGGISGLTVLSNARQIAESFTEASGALLVSAVGILSLFNAFGSPIFGILSDRAGRKNALVILFLICTLSLWLLPLTSTYTSFLLVASLVVLCYAGLFGIFPTASADYFGTRHLGMNYGLLFSSYGLSALAGPPLAARFVDTALVSSQIAGASAVDIRIAVANAYGDALWIIAAACLAATIIAFIFLDKPASRNS